MCVSSPVIIVKQVKPLHDTAHTPKCAMYICILISTKLPGNYAVLKFTYSIIVYLFVSSKNMIS